MSEPADLERMGIPTISDLQQTMDSSGTVVRCSSGYDVGMSGMSHNEWHRANPSAAIEARHRASRPLM